MVLEENKQLRDQLTVAAVHNSSESAVAPVEASSNKQSSHDTEAHHRRHRHKKNKTAQIAMALVQGFSAMLQNESGNSSSDDD